MILHKYQPHPRVAARKREGPITTDSTRLSVSDRIAARATKVFGTMPMTYLFVVYGALGAVLVRYQATLLYWSNWIQLWSLPLLMVGGLVLGRAGDKRAVQTFADTEALLHGQQQLAEHLAAQDAVISELAMRLGVDMTAYAPSQTGDPA